jgi:Ca-activated chloride channel family protein
MFADWNIGFIFPLHQLPWWLAAGGAFLALLGFVLRRYERLRRGRVARFVESGLASRLLRGFDERVRRPLFWFALLGFAALLLALAQPRWGQAWQEVYEQSHDVIVCLDTSESMRAPNPLPSRMERAKQKIVSLVERAPGDRFALVAFSGAAQLQSPFTADHGYFGTVLRAIDTDTISIEGTDIAAAIETAVKLFRDEDQKSGTFRPDTRAILLISDGEAVSGDAVAVAEEASKYCRVYVIGVGDPNGAEIRLPDWMARYMQGVSGSEVHLSRLDEESLMQVALAGNGAYIRSTPDNSDIEQIHDMINQLSTRHVGSDIRLHLINRYQWPLAFATACFAAEGLWLALLPWVRWWRSRRSALTVQGGARE